VAEIVEPNQLLLLTGDQGRWSWVLELRRVAGDRTRLVTRMNSRPGLLGRVLDPADLIVLPRLLTGLKQRVEGTLPGMPGTHTGTPLPTARLPVHWWATVAWLAGLALFATTARRSLGLGRWARTRRHPFVLAGVAFVAGAGYLIMSDTPPVQFFIRAWVPGLALAAAGLLLAPLVTRYISGSADRAQPFRRMTAAFTEAGLFLVIPVTVAWQAATNLGWTSSAEGRLAVGTVAAAAATAIATLAWSSDGWRPALAVAAVFAAGYALTGSALVPLLGAVVLELTAATRAARTGRVPRRAISQGHTV
jgi:hypothetical protein